MSFGLENKRLDELVRAVSAGDPMTISHAEVEARFAGAAWSAFVEPGDGTAGALIGAVGPAQALNALLDGRSSRYIGELVADADPQLGEAIVPELDDALKRWQPRVKSAGVIHSLEQAARVDARLMVPGDPEWPSGLADLGRHGPIVLWRRGSSQACEDTARSVALVGARASTGYGEQMTMELSAGLVQRGFAIVSGAAYGIDGMAHRAALATEGVTVAILAGGVDRFYPSGHTSLLERIVQQGAVLSEVPCGAAPTKWRFLQRNRLIASVAAATVVVEAGRRSGSLNTAGHAAALGRPLGAVPGPVTSPASAGCHRLIRDYDALCVTSIDEVSELVDGVIPNDYLPGMGDPSPEQVRILDALSTRSPRRVDDVAARSGLAVATVSAVLGLFSLDGLVRQAERGWLRVAAHTRH